MAHITAKVTVAYSMSRVETVFTKNCSWGIRTSRRRACGRCGSIAQFPFEFAPSLRILCTSCPRCHWWTFVKDALKYLCKHVPLRYAEGVCLVRVRVTRACIHSDPSFQAPFSERYSFCRSVAYMYLATRLCLSAREGNIPNC